MEMMEVIRTWKKFGRPLSLVDKNTKITEMTNTTHPIDEGVRLLLEWLRHWQSQQLVTTSIFTCSLLSYLGYINDETVLFMLEGSIFDIWDFMMLLFPWFLILFTVVGPFWVIASLFPFKWDLLQDEQIARISKHLNVVIILLVLSHIVIPFMISVTSYSFVSSIILFFVSAYLMSIAENIRMVTTIEEAEFEVPITGSDIVRSSLG